MIPTITQIFVFPIKSLSRTAVAESTFVPAGGLAHDREFALFDPNGDVINAKRNPRIHGIEAKYDLAAFTVSLNGQRFHLIENRTQLERWFSDYFGVQVTMKRDTHSGFPDDPAAPGPTILSVATLDEVNAWFPDLDRAQIGRRFRANMEIGGVPAFWEDRLYGKPEEVIEFKVGAVTFHGINPCARCAVPSRHPDTGEVIPDFQKTFIARREATLPHWAAPGRFNHFYRLSVNTRVPSSEVGNAIRVGDVIVGPQTAVT